MVKLAAEERLWIVLVTEPVAEETITVVVAPVVAERETLVLALAEADVDSDDELEELAVILNGNEYWKVDGLESRVSLKP